MNRQDFIPLKSGKGVSFSNVAAWKINRTTQLDLTLRTLLESYRIFTSRNGVPFPFDIERFQHVYWIESFLFIC